MSRMRAAIGRRVGRQVTARVARSGEDTPDNLAGGRGRETSVFYYQWFRRSRGAGAEGRYSSKYLLIIQTPEANRKVQETRYPDGAKTQCPTLPRRRKVTSSLSAPSIRVDPVAEKVQFDL